MKLVENRELGSSEATARVLPRTEIESSVPNSVAIYSEDKYISARNAGRSRIPVRAQEVVS